MDRIVGTVGRCQDFPEGFSTKRAPGLHDARLKRIEEAMRKGTEFSIIELYKVKDDYYVLDGHHRVVAAREVGQRDIDAHVVEYLPMGKNPEDALYRESAFFEMKTKLVDVRLSQRSSYHVLLGEIEQYRKRLQGSDGTATPMEDAARSWYREVYQPTVREIENSGVMRFFVALTPGDLYACLQNHQELRFRKRLSALSNGLVKDPKRLSAELYALIEEDRSLTSKKTIEKLEQILPPCLYISYCPRWPAQEGSPHPGMPRSGISFSDAFGRLMRILSRVTHHG